MIVTQSGKPFFSATLTRYKRTTSSSIYHLFSSQAIAKCISTFSTNYTTTPAATNLYLNNKLTKSLHLSWVVGAACLSYTIVPLQEYFPVRSLIRTLAVVRGRAVASIVHDMSCYKDKQTVNLTSTPQFNIPLLQLTPQLQSSTVAANTTASLSEVLLAVTTWDISWTCPLVNW